MVEWMLVGSGISLVAGLTVHETRKQKKYRETYRYVRILQHEDNLQTVQQVKHWMQVMSEYKRTWGERQNKGREWFRLLFYKDSDGKIAIYLGFPEDRITGLKNLIKNTYPLSEIHDVAHDEMPFYSSDRTLSGAGEKKKKQELECGYFELQGKGNREGLALQSYAGENSLEEILLSLHAVDSEAWLDVVFSPESTDKLKRIVHRSSKDILEKKLRQKNASLHSNSGHLLDGFMEEVKDSFSLQPHQRKSKPVQARRPAERKVTPADLDQDERAQIQMMQKRYTGREAVFQVSIRLLVVGNYAQALAQTAAANIRSFYQMDNGLRFVKNRSIRAKIEDTVTYNPPHTFIMTGDELASLVRLPEAQHRVMENVPFLQKGQRSLKPDELTEGISVGTLIHPIQKKRKVRIAHKQMNKMFLLTGKTGSGKSSELLEMFESLIDDWIKNPKTAPGFTLSDPARDTAATILNRLRQKEHEGQHVDWSRVHYFFAGDPEYSMPLNLLFNNHGEMPDDVVQSAMDMLTRLYGGYAPQMERVMRNALTTLVLDKSQKHTILGILPLLRDKRFRQRVLAQVHETTIKEFWSLEFPPLEQKLDSVISPILNRLSPFNTNTLMRRMFGQKNWNLEIRKWMDEGHIVLFNWRGVNEQILTLAGEKITNQYHAEFQSRSTSAKTHYCIWDEAHRTPFQIIEKMIAEDRKFGASCGFSTQFPEQLPPGLLKSFKEISGNVMTTTLGKESAAIIQGATAGKFSAQFLQDLPERVVAIYTGVKNGGKSEQTTFTVECEPPYLYKPDGSGQWANHEDEREMEQALLWGLAKGRELMIRDSTAGRKADEEIEEYLRPGSILKSVSALNEDNGEQGELIPLKTASSSSPKGPILTKESRDSRIVAPRVRKAPSLFDDDTKEEEEEIASGAILDSWDDLYDAAKEIIIEAGEASVALLQRRMRIGYTRAARLIDALEQTKIVGPYDGTKPRKLLVKSEMKQEWNDQDLPFSSSGTGSSWD